MRDIRLSTAEHFPEASSFFGLLAKDYDPNPDNTVTVNAIPWATLWSYLNEILENKGDTALSEVGTTWMGHFIEKDGLREFSQEDVRALGGFQSFHDSVWQSTTLLTDDRIFGVPWLADTRVVYYWRSDLKEAGIDERNAFSTPEQFENTLRTLYTHGKTPWGAPTFTVTNTLHLIASWIWNSGGDFVSQDGKRTTFCEPEALKGIEQFFRLFRYMPHGFDSLDQILDAFEDRQVSVIIDGSWFLMRQILGGATEESLADLGTALPPGPSFVGGSDLVIWRHCSPDMTDIALDLIAHLTSAEVQKAVCEETGLLPVRPKVFNQAPYGSDPHYDTFAQALKLGRSLPMIYMWGPLEDALVKAFGEIWSEIIDCTDCSALHTVVGNALKPVAKRFDRLLRLMA